MKKIFLIAVLLAAFPAIAAQTFTWDASTGATGYKLKCGTVAGGPYANVSDVGSARSKVLDLSPGPNFCVATAYNAVAESGPSNEVAIPLPPGAPQNLKVVITISLNPDTGRYELNVGAAQ